MGEIKENRTCVRTLSRYLMKNRLKNLWNILLKYIYQSIFKKFILKCQSSDESNLCVNMHWF